MAPRYRFLVVLLAAYSASIITVSLYFYISSQNKFEALSTGSGHYLLVVVILSQPNALEHRNAIRQTWIKSCQEKPQGVLVKFSIGISGLPEQVLSDLANEQESFNDLLLLHNVYDSYSNLTMKVLNSFLYVNNNYNYSYILKCDDDSFVVLDVVVEELDRRKSNRSYYWGHMNNRAKVFTEGKFAEPKWLLSDHYLPHATGFGYVLSSDLIKCIANTFNGLTLYSSEVVSIGAWISPYKIQRRNDMRFDPFFEGKRCNYTIAVRLDSATQMFSVYESYTRKGTLCYL